MSDTFGLYGVVVGMTSIVLFLDICFVFVVERFVAIKCVPVALGLTQKLPNMV